MYTEYEVYMFTRYEDMKAKKNAKIGIVWGLGSPKVIRNMPFNRVHMTCYLTCIDAIHLSCTVFKL